MKKKSHVARVAFTTSRELEFFTESELTRQIGYPKGLWPLVLIKELFDNATDACETAGTGAIEIVVQLDEDSISVSDNGPGLSSKIIKGVLDYKSRISDKRHYIAPTRGQLGNALKCVIAAPFVATGKTSVIQIVSRGVASHDSDSARPHCPGTKDQLHEGERIGENRYIFAGSLARGIKLLRGQLPRGFVPFRQPARGSRGSD